MCKDDGNHFAENNMITLPNSLLEVVLTSVGTAFTEHVAPDAIEFVLARGDSIHGAFHVLRHDFVGLAKHHGLFLLV